MLNNFFLSLRYFLSSLQKNDNFIIFVWSLILSTLFFSPYIFLKNPHFNFFGDVAILYFPQFVEGYRMAQSGVFFGIDFLTSNGSTAYFLRPNIPVYYPPYLLAYALFSYETIEGLARAFIFVMYAHCILSGYYCMKIGRKYFEMTQGSSILFAVLYFGAISYSAFTAPPFYYVAALFPFLLYIALKSFNETNWWRISFYSFPYVMVFLSGYLPLDVNAVLIALIFSFFFFWQRKKNELSTYNFFIRLLLPVALASTVVITYYFSMFFYHKLVTGIPEGVWHSAHQLSFESKDIFALLSRAFPASNAGTGIPFVQLGLAPIFLLTLAFFQRKKLAISPSEVTIISFSLLIFVFYFLLSFGRLTGLPDIFYFVMPVISKMHLYGRFLLIASFFFYLAVAISFKYILHYRSELPIGRAIAVIFIMFLFAQLYNQIFHPVWLNLDLLIIELMLIAFIAISLSSQQIFYPTLIAIAVSFCIHAANFNSFTNSFNQVAVGPYKNDVAFSPVRRELLLNYFKNYSNKQLIKYVDITSGIEKQNGVLLNFPWMVSDKLKLSNYMGYEPHMAVDRDYMTLFPHPYYGNVNLSWLLRTGADFVIFNDASWLENSSRLDNFIDKNIPILDLWYGYKVAKLKDTSMSLDLLPSNNSSVFDNGIVRISNSFGSVLVPDFTTDLISYVHFKVDSTSPINVRYLLFPHKMMELRINGALTKVELKEGLLEFSLPPGQHDVNYSYKNNLHYFFLIIYLSYFLYLFCLVFWRFCLWLKLSRDF